jgi:hypothetical protein
MMETMGKPDKDINESMKHICDVVQKRIDEAYQRGLKDGKEYGFDESDMREAVSYQKGLDDAWDAARKIVEMSDPPYWELFDEYKENLFGKISAAEAIEKLKAYEEKQKADELKAGDIVYLSGDKYIVSYINDDGCADLIHIWSGSTCERVSPDCLTRTGKHYDIEKILEEMKA